MPQMMPINWMMSFTMFIIIFILFNVMNYYIMLNFNNKNKNKNNFYMKNLIWKW
uniref:ATP synthase F0 subunit 8 n=1 Tax=Iotaphora admirabilis TaxID=2203017 RepID=A0A7T0M6E0_IOTAD|nr:ATP synthase F0 subunit 8 [Iotaphora admirabilis]QPL16798.1 ATP synthase F0 subunit 8 [Iotaphora admirabilis]